MFVLKMGSAAGDLSSKIMELFCLSKHHLVLILLSVTIAYFLVGEVTCFFQYFTCHCY